MKYLDKISILLIPYLTICGVFFHIAFWETFNLNGLSFIGISDIIKSSVYPIYSVAFVIIYNLIIQNLFSDPAKKEIKFQRQLTDFQIFIWYLIVKVFFVLIFYFIKPIDTPAKFILFGFLDGLLFSLFLLRSDFLKEILLKDKVRTIVIEIIVFLPIFSYYAGKYSSSNIYQNINYQYTVITTFDSTTKATQFDTLKLIFNTDKYFVFTDLKNEKNIFKRADSVNTLVLFYKK